MLLAAHQPNFLPWYPFFLKMEIADLFVLLTHVQYEKNGWQNRAKIYDNYWTKPIKRGTKPIIEKHYDDGNNLAETNIQLIIGLAKILSIDISKLKIDFPTHQTGTGRIVQLCNFYGANNYLTNPSATEKYLDEQILLREQIQLVPFESAYKGHLFEAFGFFGIEGTRKMLMKDARRFKGEKSF